MARRKVHVTRTTAPIHFEDLEPHRFEDLVRQLIYDFRDWQSIESTGRAGSDGGFDARAYERVLASTEPLEDEEPPHPMEGNRWMIQAKREKELGPSDVKSILEDVSNEDPPYGYILAAAATFSKDSFDLFRETLRAKGVMEFYLWGKGELEDMLYLPKNDRLLFTFFGMSLATKRRSRTTEIRAFVSTKNKLQRIFGDAPEFHKDVLIRDVNDDHYPYEGEVSDFKERPPWLTRVAFQTHPLGFLVHSREHLAFVDHEKKEWDFVSSVNTLWPSSLSDEERKERHDALDAVRDIWSHLPRSQQGTFAVEGFIKYESILFVDAEGDRVHKYPHIYVEFDPQRGPYDGRWERLSIGCEPIDLGDGWQRIEHFPKKPPKKAKASQSPKGKVTLDAPTLAALEKHSADVDTLFALDNRFDSLKARQVVEVLGAKEPSFLRVMYVWKGKLADYLRHHRDSWSARRLADQQTGQTLANDDEVTVIEVERAYAHQWTKT